MLSSGNFVTKIKQRAIFRSSSGNSEQATFERRPKRKERVSHVAGGRKESLRRISMYKVLKEGVFLTNLKNTKDDPKVFRQSN
jgi:hypothetical protein